MSSGDQWAVIAVFAGWCCHGRSGSVGAQPSPPQRAVLAVCLAARPCSPIANRPSRLAYSGASSKAFTGFCPWRHNRASPISQKGRSGMRCLYCGRRLPLLRRLGGRGQEFCSEEHRAAYFEELDALALARLAEARRSHRRASQSPPAFPQLAPVVRAPQPSALDELRAYLPHLAFNPARGSCPLTPAQLLEPLGSHPAWYRPRVSQLSAGVFQSGGLPGSTAALAHRTPRARMRYRTQKPVVQPLSCSLGLANPIDLVRSSTLDMHVPARPCPFRVPTRPYCALGPSASIPRLAKLFPPRAHVEHSRRLIPAQPTATPRAARPSPCWLLSPRSNPPTPQPVPMCQRTRQPAPLAALPSYPPGQLLKHLRPRTPARELSVCLSPRLDGPGYKRQPPVFACSVRTRARATTKLHSERWLERPAQFPRRDPAPVHAWALVLTGPKAVLPWVSLVGLSPPNASPRPAGLSCFFLLMEWHSRSPHYPSAKLAGAHPVSARPISKPTYVTEQLRPLLGSVAPTRGKFTALAQRAQPVPLSHLARCFEAANVPPIGLAGFRSTGPSPLVRAPFDRSPETSSICRRAPVALASPSARPARLRFAVGPLGGGRLLPPQMGPLRKRSELCVNPINAAQTPVHRKRRSVPVAPSLPQRSEHCTLLVNWAKLARQRSWRLVPRVLLRSDRLRRLTLALAVAIPTVVVVSPFLSRQQPQRQAGAAGGIPGLTQIWRAGRVWVSARAAIRLVEDFRSGLTDWEGASNWASSWSYDQAGLVVPGRLALWQPTKELRDYTVSLVAYIDRGGVGCAIRVVDPGNFAAVKLETVDGRGLASASVSLWLVRESVRRLVERRRVPGLIRMDRAQELAVEVKGPMMVVWVNGQLVSSFEQHGLEKGGVGLFCDPGERARIVRLAVTHQDDWLGRACAALNSWLSTADKQQ